VKNEPLVSFIIPCYNHEHYVQACIESVIGLAYANVELLVIDDGSRDGSREKVLEMWKACELRFARFEFMAHEENRGLSATLNEGLAWCRGKYYAVIASDDAVLPHQLTTLLPLLEEDGRLAAAFGGLEYVDEVGMRLGWSERREMMHSFDELLLQIRQPPAPGALLRREAVLQVGGYDAEISFEDWYMWLRLTQAGWGLRSVGTAVAKYRRVRDGLSQNYRKMYMGRMQVLSEYHSHSLHARAMSRVCLNTARDAARFEGRFALDTLRKANLEPLGERLRVLVKIFWFRIFQKKDEVILG
jgi:alpha-1,3-rhamnosyltransferase